MAGEGTDTKPSRVANALKTILSLDPQVYCNVVGTPTVRLPPAQEDHEGDEWPLQSARVRAWIAETIWDRAGIVLLEKDITRMLTVLEGKAWHDQRLDLELKDAMDQDPVLEAVVIWIRENPRFEGTQTKLLGELSKIGKKYGVDMRGKAWPKGAAQLSLRINKLIPLLLKAGVEVEIGRKAGGQRFIVLARKEKETDIPKGCDDADQAASHPASADKSHHPKPLRHSDDGGGDVFEKLKNQLN